MFTHHITNSEINGTDTIKHIHRQLNQSGKRKKFLELMIWKKKKSLKSTQGHDWKEKKYTQTFDLFLWMKQETFFFSFFFF